MERKKRVKKRQSTMLHVETTLQSLQISLELAHVITAHQIGENGAVQDLVIWWAMITRCAR